MSFVAHKTLIVNGAANTLYTIEFPLIGDGNYSGHGHVFKLYPHMEIANMSGGIVYAAFDRNVITPAGMGVQGTLNPAIYPSTGPIAATQGDFDIAISTGNGWGALDASIPMGATPNGVYPTSRFMTLLLASAGLVLVSFGDQL